MRLAPMQLGNFGPLTEAMVDDGAPLSISHAVLDGVERGDSHAVAQMRTLIVQAHEQIATLEVRAEARAIACGALISGRT